tara:strand:- start:781 stop:882 length:102 start_codon:yes stop_codon:yes gene_type:complete
VEEGINILPLEEVVLGTAVKGEMYLEEVALWIL